PFGLSNILHNRPVIFMLSMHKSPKNAIQTSLQEASCLWLGQMRMHRIKQRHPPRQTRRICRPQAKPSTIFDPARNGPRSNYTRVISISNERCRKRAAMVPAPRLGETPPSIRSCGSCDTPRLAALAMRIRTRSRSGGYLLEFPEMRTTGCRLP
ncbi:hypothetical protein N5P37_003112, partial [Trichoderma harzianum]